LRPLVTAGLIVIRGSDGRRRQARTGRKRRQDQRTPRLARTRQRRLVLGDDTLDRCCYALPAISHDTNSAPQLGRKKGEECHVYFESYAFLFSF
jgi:hypothetical protein